MLSQQQRERESLRITERSCWAGWAQRGRAGGMRSAPGEPRKGSPGPGWNTQSAALPHLPRGKHPKKGKALPKRGKAPPKRGKALPKRGKAFPEGSQSPALDQDLSLGAAGAGWRVNQGMGLFWDKLSPGSGGCRAAPVPAQLPPGRARAALDSAQVLAGRKGPAARSERPHTQTLRARLCSLTLIFPGG